MRKKYIFVTKVINCTVNNLGPIYPGQTLGARFAVALHHDACFCNGAINMFGTEKQVDNA